MSIVESESLVLKSYNLSEADRIVVLLTRDHGVVRGVAKGAKRLKSKFGSGLEPFSVVKASYFQKESRELVSLDRVELKRSYFRAASDPDFLSKFSYLAEMIIAFSPPHDPNELLYRMVKACLETADEDPGSLTAIGVYFELWLLKLAGYMPNWAVCDACGRTLEDDESAQLNASFHLLCPKCSRSAGGRSVTPLQRRMFARARNLKPAEFASDFAGSDAELRELSSLLKRMISQAIGRNVVDERAAGIPNTI